MLNHVMLDLETFGTSSTAVVTTIGAVKFDPFSGAIGETFYMRLRDLERQQSEYGRTVDAGTVRWWLQQDEATRKEQYADMGNMVSTKVALEEFSNFASCFDPGAGTPIKTYMWGNGADFDNMILGSLYDGAKMKKPWTYGANRCYRTMKAMRKDIVQIRVGIHHNALDDAMTQALHLQKIIKEMRYAEV